MMTARMRFQEEVDNRIPMVGRSLVLAVVAIAVLVDFVVVVQDKLMSGKRNTRAVAVAVAVVVAVATMIRRRRVCRMWAREQELGSSYRCYYSMRWWDSKEY